MRKLFLLTAMSAFCCVMLAACGESTNTKVTTTAGNAANTVANTATSAANTVANAVSNATTSGPESFMKDAAQGGMAEVKMGELATKNAKDPEIKKFGQMMMTDHGAAGCALLASAAVVQSSAEAA